MIGPSPERFNGEFLLQAGSPFYGFHKKTHQGSAQSVLLWGTRSAYTACSLTGPTCSVWLPIPREACLGTPELRETTTDSHNDTELMIRVFDSFR